MCFFKQKGQEAVLGLTPMARLKLPQSSAPVRWNHAGHFPVERLRWYRCSVDRRAQDRKRPSELLQKKDRKGWVWMTCPSLVKPNYAHPTIDSIDQLGCVWKCFVWPPPSSYWLVSRHIHMSSCTESTAQPCPWILQTGQEYGNGSIWHIRIYPIYIYIYIYMESELVVS